MSTQNISVCKAANKMTATAVKKKSHLKSYRNIEIHYLLAETSHVCSFKLERPS